MTKVEIEKGIPQQVATYFTVLAETSQGNQAFQYAIVQMAMNILAERQLYQGINAADYTKKMVKQMIDNHKKHQH